MKKIIFLAISLALCACSVDSFETDFVSMIVDGNEVRLMNLEGEKVIHLSDAVYTDEAQSIFVENGILTSLQGDNAFEKTSETTLIADHGSIQKIRNFEIRSCEYQATLNIRFKENTVKTDFSFKKDIPILERIKTPINFSYRPSMSLVSIEEVSGAYYAVYQFEVVVYQNGNDAGTLSFNRKFPVSSEAVAFITIDDTLNEVVHIITI